MTQKHAVYESSRVETQDSAALSDTHGGYLLPGYIQQTLPRRVTFLLGLPTPFDQIIFPLFFSSLLVLVFKRNHFFGNETGIFPHIMHINGYQRLTG